MDPFSSFGLPPFDPSKMDPKLLMELSQLIQQLPPAQLSKMQGLMHNAQAGFDVKNDLQEFERNLPPGFREKVMAIFTRYGGSAPIEVNASSHETSHDGGSSSSPAADHSSANAGSSAAMDVREARLTLLRAVADGTMSPEDAERLLFG